MREVFVAVREIVEEHVQAATEMRLTLKNSSGRTVLISLSHDPDVSIQEVIQVSLETVKTVKALPSLELPQTVGASTNV